MKNKLTKSIFTFLAIFTSGAFLISVPPVSATQPTNICDRTDLPASALEAAGCGSTATREDLPNIIVGILNSVIGIMGVVAVIAIVVGGFWYMTSAGDAGKVKKAKDTILYACIGLVVCALAAVIVNWTISVINGSSAPAGGSEGNTEEVIEADPAETSFLSENSIAFLEKKL